MLASQTREATKTRLFSVNLEVEQTATVLSGREPIHGADVFSINFANNETPGVLDAACVAACKAHDNCDYVVRMGAACYLKQGQMSEMANNPVVNTLIPN